VKFKRKQAEDRMGLDMYAYVGRKGQYDEFYEKADWDEAIKDFSGPISKPHEIAYWRKHPSLHGWMEKLWQSQGNKGTFNGIELELTWKDVDNLERAIKYGQLPNTDGYFFGKPADNYYYEDDLKFCVNAKAELFLGLKVFYNSSW
jgi:hypothetical protein